MLAALPFGANVLAAALVRGNAVPEVPYHTRPAVYVKAADGRWRAVEDIHQRSSSELKLVKVLYAGHKEEA